nr:MAG TPA: hypothetical protein [Caudoviricetes sp.]
MGRDHLQITAGIRRCPVSKSKWESEAQDRGLHLIPRTSMLS